MSNPISIAITSKVPLKKKLSFSLYLAHYLASFGRKVLLVDVDFERSELTKWLKSIHTGKDSAPYDYLNDYINDKKVITDKPEDRNVIYIQVKDTERIKAGFQSAINNLVSSARTKGCSAVIFTCGLNEDETTVSIREKNTVDFIIERFNIISVQTSSSTLRIFHPFFLSTKKAHTSICTKFQPDSKPVLGCTMHHFLDKLVSKVFPKELKSNYFSSKKNSTLFRLRIKQENAINRSLRMAKKLTRCSLVGCFASLFCHFIIPPLCATLLLSLPSAFTTVTYYALIACLILLVPFFLWLRIASLYANRSRDDCIKLAPSQPSQVVPANDENTSNVLSSDKTTATQSSVPTSSPSQ